KTASEIFYEAAKLPSRHCFSDQRHVLHLVKTSSRGWDGPSSSAGHVRPGLRRARRRQPPIRGAGTAEDEVAKIVRAAFDRRNLAHPAGARLDRDAAAVAFGIGGYRRDLVPGDPALAGQVWRVHQAIAVERDRGEACEYAIGGGEREPQPDNDHEIADDAGRDVAEDGNAGGAFVPRHEDANHEDGGADQKREDLAAGLYSENDRELEVRRHAPYPHRESYA